MFWQNLKMAVLNTSYFEKNMEICFITASYLSLICLIFTSYMMQGWLWWRLNDTVVRAFSMIVKTSPITRLHLQLYIGSRNGRNLCKQCVLANTDGPYTCRRCSIGAELSTYNCRGCRNENPEFGEESMEILLSLNWNIIQETGEPPVLSLSKQCAFVLLHVRLTDISWRMRMQERNRTLFLKSCVMSSLKYTGSP